MPLVLNWQTFCRQTSSVQVRVNSCQIACTSIKYDSTSVHLFLCYQINCIFFIIHVYFQQFSKFIVILLFFRCQLINQGVFFWPSTCLRASPTKAPSALQENEFRTPKNQKKKAKQRIQFNKQHYQFSSALLILEFHSETHFLSRGPVY